MIKDINTYLAFRRAAGFELHNDEYLLHSYARFADASNEMFIRTSSAIKWASQSVSVAQRDVRLKALCRFARYICLEDGVFQASCRLRLKFMPPYLPCHLPVGYPG
jgi:integrase/recombinase XerD